VTTVATFLGSALVAAIVAGLFSLRTKRNEYINDYYKEVIKRRVAAYEQLEQLIIWLKTAIPDKDGQLYHLLFASNQQEDLNRIFEMLFRVMSQGVWFSDEAFSKTRELNLLLYQLQDAANITEFGKKHYRQIANIRADLERTLARDMLKLHCVKQFLKSKDKPDQGFVPVNLGHVFESHEKDSSASQSRGTSTSK
jgi:hypothetical protein